MEIGYLGPKGTFTEKAAICYSQTIKRVPYQSIEDIINDVNNNLIEIGVVPIENSIEGTVNATMDMLIFNSDIKILKEIAIPIDQNLIVNRSYNGGEIKKILSHPQALGQCRHFLNKYYHNAVQIATSSTAEAAKLISMSKEPLACLANSLCAELYNLKILHNKIQDNKTNETRFIVIDKDHKIENISNCKTSIAFSTLNKPGALFKVLNILELWDINMTKIISRPMKTNIGEYAFFAEVEGNLNDDNIQNAIKMIERKTSFYKLFGSYTVLKEVI